MITHTFFNQRLRVEFCESPTDTDGEQRENWQEFGHVWASVRRLTLAGHHHTEHFRLRVRSHTFLPRKVRFHWAGRVLTPLAPPLREDRRAWVDWIVENQAWQLPRPSSSETQTPPGTHPDTCGV